VPFGTHPSFSTFLHTNSSNKIVERLQHNFIQSHTNNPSVYHQLQDDINFLSIWCSANGLLLNHFKLKFHTYLYDICQKFATDWFHAI